MAAVIAAHRNPSRAGAVNSSAPYTQASAPVIEFRCTYTREAYKKAPKFHDGTISYHTFNKVIVLYDDTRRVVTNHHYRGDEEVNEGVRLSFDRSILVDVAEPAGQTQTDLNQVLRQRTSPGKSAHHAARNVRTTTIASQGRPRSLRDVLGASQGPIGRARLPSQTPYEQRQIYEVSHPEEPPAKRLKGVAGKENLPLKATAKLPSPPLSRPKPRTEKTRSSWQPGSTQEAVGRVEELHYLSSDEEVIPPVKLRRKEIDSRLELQQNSETAAKLTLRDAAMRPVTKNSSHETESKSCGQKHNKNKPCTVNVHAPIVLVDGPKNTPRVYTPRPGTSQLLLSKQKPRRKLMYRDLFCAPCSDAAPPHTRTAPKTSKSPRSKRNSSPHLIQGGLGPMRDHSEFPSTVLAPAGDHVDFMHRSCEDIDRRGEPETPRPRQPGQQGSVSAPIDLMSSPMFVSKGEEPPTSPSQHIESSQDFEVHMSQGANPVEAGSSSEHPITLSPKPSPARSSTPNHGPFLDHDDDSVNLAEPHSALLKTRQEWMPPPPRPVPVPCGKPLSVIPPLTPSKQPLRRVLSENDAFHNSTDSHRLLTTSDDEEEPFPSLLADADFPPTAAVLHTRHTPLKRNNHPPLRRTLSDPVPSDPVPSSIDSNAATTSHVTSFNVEPVTEEPKGEGETGPWTMVEAWLLFDVAAWPQDMRKELPEWMIKAGAGGLGGRLAGGEGGGGASAAVGGIGGMMGAGGASVGGGFSSAKGLWYEHTAQGTGVLRDEAGAL